MNIYKKLLSIQNELKAPKGQYNSFGKYHYRSCEDILEAVKPLCLKENVTLTLSDELIQIGDRYYVKATARLFDENEEIIVSAYAREDENIKGMQSSQITGSCSSYSRKYSLNGLFNIDDNKDSDSTNTHGKDKSDSKEVKPEREVTDEYINKLFELGEKAGYNKKQIFEQIEADCKNANPELMTKAEYKKLYLAYDKLAKLKQ